METWSRSSEGRDQAASVLRNGFPKLDLMPDDNGVFALTHAGVSEERWALQSLRIRGFAVLGGSLLDPYAVGRVVSGSAALSYGGDDVDVSSPYLRTVGQSQLRAADASFEMVTLEPVAFERSARRYLAGTPLKLIPPSTARTRPVSPEAGGLWTIAYRYALHVAGDSGLRQSRLVRDQVHDLLVRTLLTAFPVTSEASSVVGPPAVATPRSIRRALDHVDAHLSESVTVADLAAVAGCSVRALQAGIRRHTGTSAMSYLRDRRLDAARSDLLLADPTATTVASIAQRWGFAHQSRFSRDYVGRFGEYPRDTLRT